MKKLFIFMLMLLLIAGSYSIAQADGRYGREDQRDAGYVISKSSQVDVAITSVPTYVYAVTVYANAASSYVNLHDNTSSSDTSKIKIEVGEATQYRTTREVFDPPVQFSTAVYADVTNGSVVVEYR